MEEKVQDVNSAVETNPQKKKPDVVLIVIISFIILLFCIAVYFMFFYKNGNKELENSSPNNTKVESEVEPIYFASNYKLKGNGLEAFDLLFMQMNNNNKNVVYSPLSIKYALLMLAEGAEGETKTQITDLIGNYQPKKYINSANMSFANALFVRTGFNVKDSYINNLKNKFNAEVKYDSFANASAINNWVSEKTLKLLNNLVDDKDVQVLDFALINALALDMEWNNLLSSNMSIKYDKESSSTGNNKETERYAYSVMTTDVRELGYYDLLFNDKDVAAIEIAATYNKYDIVKELGEDYIRKTVGDAYDEYYAKHPDEFDASKTKEDFLNEYMKLIKANYKKNGKSTDFEYYTDNNVKVFAKDLKEYDGQTLQYVAIMPTNENLSDYIKDINASDINKIISNLKDLKESSFEDGYVTIINGIIPMFKYEYDLPLENNLKLLGINKIFKEDAELSNIAEDAIIEDVKHKANIELSNEGIKAAAATMIGGYGDMNAGFDYLFEVPVKKIDLTFDKPYMYLIRDKKTGEVWFAGSVYEPCEYNEYNASHSR